MVTLLAIAARLGAVELSAELAGKSQPASTAQSSVLQAGSTPLPPLHRSMDLVPAARAWAAPALPAHDQLLPGRCEAVRGRPDWR